MKLLWRLSGLGFVITCGILAAGVLFTGCATTEDPAFSSASAVGASPTGTPRASVGDRFAVGELVIVTFSGTLEPIQAHEERIKDDGTITLPLIGAVNAAGKTPGELQTEIHDLYVPKYYVRLTVTVKSQTRVYYIGGEVRAPGPKEYIGETTLTKAIQAAGDFTDFANKKKVKLTRNGKTTSFNCNKLENDPRLDPPVFPGDKIQVPRKFW